jgi:hypothetical protein
MNTIQQQFRSSNHPTLEAWLDEASISIGLRMSPRQPLQTRLAKYVQRYYEQQGRYVDDDDANICALLLTIKHTHQANYQ